jgi:hypothetical protein
MRESVIGRQLLQHELEMAEHMVVAMRFAVTFDDQRAGLLGDAETVERVIERLAGDARQVSARKPIGLPTVCGHAAAVPDCKDERAGVLVGS